MSCGPGVPPHSASVRLRSLPSIPHPALPTLHSTGQGGVSPLPATRAARPCSQPAPVATSVSRVRLPSLPADRAAPELNVAAVRTNRTHHPPPPTSLSPSHALARHCRIRPSIITTASIVSAAFEVPGVGCSQRFMHGRGEGRRLRRRFSTARKVTDTNIGLLPSGDSPVLWRENPSLDTSLSRSTS